jgi:hypothetical protein
MGQLERMEPAQFPDCVSTAIPEIEMDLAAEKTLTKNILTVFRN